MALNRPLAIQLKAVIDADSTLSNAPANSDGDEFIATELDELSDPAFIVWKTNVPLSEVGDNIDGAELATRSDTDSIRLSTIAAYSPDGFDPSSLERRRFFNDIFSGSGGATTRANLLALWKRTATRAEAAVAGGNGTDASPGRLKHEGKLSLADVQLARRQ